MVVVVCCNQFMNGLSSNFLIGWFGLIVIRIAPPPFFPNLHAIHNVSYRTLPEYYLKSRINYRTEDPNYRLSMKHCENVIIVTRKLKYCLKTAQHKQQINIMESYQNYCNTLLERLFSFIIDQTRWFESLSWHACAMYQIQIITILKMIFNLI